MHVDSTLMRFVKTACTIRVVVAIMSTVALVVVCQRPFVTPSEYVMFAPYSTVVRLGVIENEDNYDIFKSETDIAHMAYVEKSGNRNRFEKSNFWVNCSSTVVYPGVPIPPNCFDFNLLFRKAFKVGGSTLGGIVRRIAIRFGVAGSGDRASLVEREPKLLANHIPDEGYKQWKHTLRLPYFVWGSVRKPIARCISAFDYFRAETSDSAKIRFGGSNRCNNEVWKTLELTSRESQEDLQYMAVTERFDESALMVCYFLGCSIADILYVKSKDSQDPMNRLPKSKRHSLHVAFAKESPRVRSFFLGNKFQKRNSLDTHLWNVANQTLDRLIDFVGKVGFQTKLREFRSHLTATHEECKYVISPLVCYWRDNGCKYDCLNRYANKVPHLWDPVTVLPLLQRRGVPKLSLL